MNKEKLIEEVRKFNFLYDVNDAKYSDTFKKEEAWNKISDTLSIPVTTCKKTWSNLREAHRRAIKRKNSKSGQAAIPDKKWQFENEMDFLLPHFKERATVNSQSRDSDQESVGNEDSQLSPLDRQSDTSGHQENCIIYDRPPSEASTSSRKFSNFPKRSKKFKEDRLSASSLLMKYILHEKQNTKEEDDIDKFFSGIASTVKKFSDYNKAMIKSRIFNIVSQMELQELENQSNYGGNNNYSSVSPGFPNTSNYEPQNNAGQQNVKLEFESAQQNNFGTEKDLSEFT